jgi:outer membrane protein assembly factor BamC
VKETFGSKDIDYKSARGARPLEVPPDLTSDTIQDSMIVPGGEASYSQYSGTREQAGAMAATLLPQVGGITMQRAGTQRWLVIQTPPDKVWTRVRSFWLEKGFLLTLEQPSTGIMETDWVENRAAIKQDFIRDFFGKFLSGLYSSPLRDKFRVRLERGTEPGTTELYLSHRGLVEKVVTAPSQASPVETYWEEREPDPEIEAQMLREIMVYMGVDRQYAKSVVAGGQGAAPAQATMTTGTAGNPVLHMTDDLESAWRRVGLSLDRVGFTVEDRNRSEGVYFVRYIDPDENGKKKGFIRRMFSRDKPAPREEFQIKLEAAATGTDVSVRSKEGAPETSKIGKRILTLLHEQLK